MPGDVNLRIKGATEMERLLKQLGPQVARRVAAQALRAGAKPIVERAKELVQVRTGETKRRIAARPKRRGAGPESTVIEIGVERPRSRIFHLLEFGTAHSPAHPFMRPALDERGLEALNEMGRVLARGITREAEKLAGIKRRR